MTFSRSYVRKGKIAFQFQSSCTHKDHKRADRELLENIGQIPGPIFFNTIHYPSPMLALNLVEITFIFFNELYPNGRGLSHRKISIKVEKSCLPGYCPQKTIAEHF